jgi:hypothetical protein
MKHTDVKHLLVQIHPNKWYDKFVMQSAFVHSYPLYHNINGLYEFFLMSGAE